uniref:Reverse transcriptase zinc-binding domain-containing protein n=1 Tax=Oryza rufipogon TaxID=4529 RepID=A0A0E0QHG5_ORYRU
MSFSKKVKKEVHPSSQYIHEHNALNKGGLLSRVTLLNEIEDTILWNNVATYSAKSAYLFQFIGSQQDKVFLLNWEASMLPKQKFLGWLILHHKKRGILSLLLKNNQTYCSLKEWMSCIMQNESKTEARRKVGVLVKTWWHIWLQRNAKIFRGEEPDIWKARNDLKFQGLVKEPTQVCFAAEAMVRTYTIYSAYNILQDELQE